MAYLENREELEEMFGKRVLTLSNQHREELIRMVGDPPNPVNVPEAWWDKVRDEMARELTLAYILLIVASEERHGFTGEEARLTAEGYAVETAERVATDWARNSRDMFRAAVEDAPLFGVTVVHPPTTTRPDTDSQYIAIDDVWEAIFGEPRIDRLVMTETTRAEADGGMLAIEALQLHAVAVWRHGSSRPPRHSRASVEPCPICSPLENLTRDEWQHLRPDISAPPAHPNCDCFIEFVDPETLSPLDVTQASRV